VRQRDIDTGTVGNRAQRDAIESVRAEFRFSSIEDGGAAVCLRGGKSLSGAQKRFLSQSSGLLCNGGGLQVKAGRPLPHIHRLHIAAFPAHIQQMLKRAGSVRSMGGRTHGRCGIQLDV
jgi:hypothetical protein